MNTRWLKSFRAVAQNGSIAKAAKELFISPQALIQQINLMEKEVGFQLILRKRTGVELTPAGKEFLEGIRQVTTIYDRMMSRCRLAGISEGAIRIPVTTSVIIPEFLEKVCAKFRKYYDQPKIELILDEQSDFWLEGLQTMQYDIIEHFTVNGLCPDDIHFECFSRVDAWCIMSEWHPLAQRSSITLEDLDGFQIVAPGHDLKLMRHLQMYTESMGIAMTLEPTENNRFQIMEKINQGSIHLANESISKTFAGYTRVHLDFDTHVYHGLACRKAMYETYLPFFQLAHEIANE